VIRTADAVVIGGGIMGASTAHFLTKIGFGEVALVEKRKICGGSTQYSAAHIRQHYSNEVGIRLAVRGASMFANAENELGGPAGFVQIGYMLLAPPEGEQALRDVIPVQQSFGVETMLLEPDEVIRRWPQLQLDGVALACYEPTSGFANPVLTVESLVGSAQQRGLHLSEGCEVLGLSTAKGRVTGVVTGDGEIATGVVVNACGPWGDRIGRMVGVDYPITFSREHEAIFDAPALVTDDGFQDFPVISDVPQRLYCRPFVGGKVLVGDGWPKEKEPVDPETYDDGTDDAHVQKMVPRLVNRIPSLAPTLTEPNYGGAFVTGYSGVYDITEDWYPIVGEEWVGGYYSCFGGSGHGFKIGPAIGEALADTIAGRRPTIDISSLSGARFSEGRTFGSVWGPGNRA
jgi:sarcosine oxidase subunit beta